MNTISDHVKTWVSSHPLHAQLIHEGLINSSALARTLKPAIQKQTGEIVSLDAIVIALNRMRGQESDFFAFDFSKYIGDVSLQTNLAVLTIPQTGMDEKAFLAAIAKMHAQNQYCLHTRGIWHTALIGSNEAVTELEKKFDHSTIVETDLCGITVRLKPGHIDVPGVCAYVLQLLAMRGINIQEVASSHNELTVIIRTKDLRTAIDALTLQ